VDWPGRPAGNGRPLVLCLVGEDEVVQDVERGIGAAGAPRALTIRPLDAAAPDSGCDILYAAGSAKQSAQAALDAVQGRPVLTVTDARRGDAQGMIHFVLARGRVRLRIDAAGAARAGLSISSKLLGLALSVTR